MSPFVPLMIPLFTAILLMFFWTQHGIQRAVSVLGSAAQTVCAFLLLQTVLTQGIQVGRAGHWPAPFGILLTVDTFGALMVLITSILGLCGVIFSVATTDSKLESGGYHPLVQLLIFGVTGAFSTGDIFNLYVWFEVLLISSFVLLSLGGTRARLEGTMKYLVLNLLSSMMFLTAVGLTYGFYGALNFADLAMAVRNFEGEFDPAPILMFMYFVAFGIKAGLFPFYFWLPASYHLPHPAVSAILAGLLTKVGVYALMRVLTLVFDVEAVDNQSLVLFFAGATMVTGVLGALAQNSVRRILSFHIVSQIGYMIMGLGIGSVLGLAGGIFYMCHHMLVKANLFLIGGAVEREKGTGQLKPLGGIFGSIPVLGVLFLISAFSLAGIPPFSGFFAKFILVRSGMQEGTPIIVVTSLVVSFFTLMSMMKIWNEAFWKKEPGALPEYQLTRAQKFAIRSPIVFLALFSIGIGVFAEPILQVCQVAAEDMLNPQRYIDAVFAAGGTEASK